MMVSLVSAKDRFSFSVATVLLFLFAWPSCAVHREDDSRYFLFIEPDATKKSIEPVDDDLTASLQAAWDLRVAGTSRYTDLNCPGYFTPSEAGYRGFHFAEDGEFQIQWTICYPMDSLQILSVSTMCVFIVISCRLRSFASSNCCMSIWRGTHWTRINARQENLYQQTRKVESKKQLENRILRHNCRFGKGFSEGNVGAIKKRESSILCVLWHACDIISVIR